MFGFGDALLAMPLLLLFLDPEVATPLIALTGMVISVLIAARTWRRIAWGSAGRLVLAAALGVPLGALSLRVLPAEAIRLVLAGVLVAYGLWGLLGREPVRPVGEGWSWVLGFASGWLGGAVTTPGPPVVVYAALRRWEPDRIRGTLQAFFLPVGLVMVASHGAMGLWSPAVFRLFAWAVGPVVLATLLGEAASRRVPAARFRRALQGLLVALGALLVLHG